MRVVLVGRLVTENNAAFSKTGWCDLNGGLLANLLQLSLFSYVAYVYPRMCLAQTIIS
jgi:hypothetical protein